MKTICFTTARELLTGERVAAGEQWTGPDAEADAYVNNGVAVHTADTTDNGGD